MISIKRYGYIVNKQFKVNKKRNISIISGIILSIILFTIVGYIQDYYTKTELLNYEKIEGNYEAIIKSVSKDEIDKLKNNILVNKVGIYSLLYSSDNIEEEKDISLYAADDIAINELFSRQEQLLEGSFPKNENEIAIDSIGKNYFNKNIGDTITLNNKDYKVVGILNKYDSLNMYGIDLLTYLEETKDAKQINAIFNVNSEKNKDKVIEKVLRDLGIKHYQNNGEEKVIINKK